MPGQKTVLVADSDQGLLQTLGKVLRLDGYTVESFSNGVDLISRALTTSTSLVICGYFLPGLGGLRVCRYLKGEPLTSAVPFLLLTPGVDASLRLRAEWAGVDRIEELPIRPAAFSAICRTLLEMSSADTPFQIVRGTPPAREAILEKLCTNLEDRVNRLEATWKLTEELGRTMNVRGIFRRLANGVLAGLGFDRVWVCRYLAETDELVTLTKQGRNLSGVPDSTFVRDHKDLPLGIAIRELRQVRSSEVDAADERLWWGGTMEYIDTPLVAARRPIGLIRCDRSLTGKKITDGDLEALRHTAIHTAESILNAMMLEEVTDEREQMSAIMNSLDSGILVVDGSGMLLQTTSRACELFGVESSDIIDRKIKEVLPMLAVDGDSLDRALGEEVQVLNTIVHSARSGIGDQVLSVSYIPFYRGGHFSGLVIMATDVTGEHVLRENLSRRNAELENISEVGREINSSQDIERTCSELARVLRRSFESESIAVFKADGTQNSLMPDSIQVVATAGYDQNNHPVGMKIRIDESPAGMDGGGGGMRGLAAHAVIMRKPLNISNTSEDGRYIENLSSTRSELAVPMMYQDKVVGLIDIQSPLLDRFSPESVRTVSTLANYGATALGNAVLHSQVLQASRQDKLTGLGNLRVFEEKLLEEFRRTDRTNNPFSLIMIDIDDFKHYNDSWGHPIGNTLLKTVVNAIRVALREIDLPIRYGGEEFVCLLPFAGPRDGAEVAERIRKMVMETSPRIPHANQQPLGFVSVSLGVSTYPSDVSDRNLLLEYADQRMYMGKRAGKNRVIAPELGNCQFAT